jgi:hypothetical protein
MALVTLADFKHQLGLSGFISDDALLVMKLEQATALVLDYIRRSDDDDQIALIDTWGPDTGGSPAPGELPWNIHAAILTWATELYRFRGDDGEAVPWGDHGDPSPTVKALLARNGRRPVFA